MNVAENDKEDLLHDLASIVYAFCARQNATTPGQAENRALSRAASGEG